MKKMAAWSFRHRRIVLLGWLVAVAAVFGLSQVSGSAFSSSYSLPHTESTQALNLLKANASAQSGDSEQIVIAAQNGSTLTSPAVRGQAEALFAKLATLPDVSGVASPYAAAGAKQMNAGHTIAFATLTYAKGEGGISDAAAKTLVNTARSFRTAQLNVAVDGQVASKTSGPSLGGVGFGAIAALVVLVVVFGSLLAGALPLISALLALLAATGVIGMLSHVINMPDFSGQLVLLIGLGVGVDYALFIVTRFRQSLQRGQDVESAIITAVATSGRAVLFAGAVVCIALLGMLALGVAILSGLGIAASIGVLFTMATSLTLLPALLGFFGHRVLSRRQRRHLAEGVALSETGVWWRWSKHVSRRPIAPAAVALAVLIALALPFFSLRLGNADASNDPASSTTRQAYDLLAEGFGAGFNGPLQVAVQTDTAAQKNALTAVTAAIAKDPGVATVSAPVALTTKGDTQISEFQVFPTTAPQSAATANLVTHLRHRVIPAAEGGTGIKVYIGGATATSADFASVLASKMPLFVALVVLLSFLLLMVVFRSILIPLTAALMNLLSAAAALGVLSATYVWGWGGSLLGANSGGPIAAFIPVMVFAILFGLSMDYQVFLVSRMQEEYHRSGDNKDAVTRGLAITGRTISAAALIMILVFGSFVLGGNIIIKEFGLGLAVAVAVDAFLIRIAIVPALMFLLGRSNWWVPGPLARVLPRLPMEEEAGLPDEDLRRFPAPVH
jgi:putative drug exporter of the RND superfamily